MKIHIYLLAGLAFVCLPVHAQQTVDPDWPCIQVLIPELSAASFWPTIIEEDIVDKWKKNKEVADLGRALTGLEAFTDKERQLIADFAAVEEDKHVRLNMLADAILTLTDRRRAKYIKGIKRYTRQQATIASQIEETLNALDEEASESTTADSAARLEVQETLNWHQRVYDQREQAIPALCDRPVALEETLSEVLRDVAQYLP